MLKLGINDVILISPPSPPTPPYNIPYTLYMYKSCENDALSSTDQYSADKTFLNL